MSPMFWLLVTGLFAVPAYLVWEDRARRRAPKRASEEQLPLVGCVARAEKVDGAMGVRVTGPDGRQHLLPARFEDLEGAPKKGQEFLVIENAKSGQSLVVVPAELPRLEEP